MSFGNKCLPPLMCELNDWIGGFKQAFLKTLAVVQPTASKLDTYRPTPTLWPREKGTICALAFFRLFYSHFW